MVEFWSVAAIAWLLLLVVLLKPLFHRRDATGRLQKLSLFKSRLAIGASVVFFVVASSALLYVYWSNGYSVLVAAPDRESDMIELTEQLATRLAQSPEDSPDGWLLLANSYTALGQYDKAVTAYAQAEHYAELEAWAQVAYAEALLISEGALGAKAMALLETAMASSSDDPKGLFLIGLANLERKNYAQTISYWEHLLTLLKADDPLASAVEKKLAELESSSAELSGGDELESSSAELSGGDNEQPLPGSASEQTEESPSFVSEAQSKECFMRVRVALASALSAKMSATDTLFVYATATEGPPMPLAIKQFKAAALPLETCLGPEDAMIEGMTIGDFDTIRIKARISKSGLATPQPGDLQVQSEAIAAVAGGLVSLVIDELLE